MYVINDIYRYIYVCNKYLYIERWKNKYINPFVYKHGNDGDEKKSNND